MKAQRALVLALVGVVSFASGGWLLQRGLQQSGGVYEKARLFEDILAHVARHSVDSLDEVQLYQMAIDGLLEQLDDPYANYLGPEDVADLRERTSGTYGGLGMQIDVRDGWITVIAPMAETPAEAAGIESGDRIIEVDGESTYGWKNEKAVIELRGEPGSEVRIKISRPGVPEPFEFNLTRATVLIRSVQAAMMLTPEIGYLSLAYSTIGESVVQEVKQSTAELIDRGAQSVVLDLRDNPGGVLDDGVELTDLFLDPDLVVVDTRGRDAQAGRTYSTRTSQQWPDVPFVVLVNGGTASAAEILAGALQDHDRAVILGTPTFGKGLVQTVFPLSPNEAFQLTTGHWYTPSGRSIQRPIRRIDGVLRIVGGFEEERADLSGDTTVVDSSTLFYTDAGRAVIGGGGIRPDITVRMDTLSDGERAFTMAIGSRIPLYRDVLATYALDVKAGNRISRPDFTVTPAMRAELVRRLTDRGVELTGAVVAGARALLDEQISYEIARYVFGRDEETKRRVRADAQVGEALTLLRGVGTTEELFARATERAASQRWADSR
jgi:carboxyl-terminal processing protease